MAEIDRLGWAAGLSFLTYGLRCGIRVSQPGIMPEVLTRLPPGWTRSSSPDVESLYSIVVGGPSGPGIKRFHMLYAGSARLARTLERARLLATLESDLKLWVAGTTRQRVFVHAGAVGWKGRGIVLPGRTYSGKSRLVEALVKAGCTYYSDEYAVLDRAGRLHPYPAALSLRDDDGGGERRLSPREMGARVGRRAIPVGLVAVTRYAAGARVRLQRVTPGKGLLAILENTVPARRRPQLAVQALSRVVAEAPVYTGRRAEAADVAARLLEMLAAGGLDSKQTKG